MNALLPPHTIVVANTPHPRSDVHPPFTQCRSLLAGGFGCWAVSLLECGPIWRLHLGWCLLPGAVRDESSPAGN